MSLTTVLFALAPGIFGQKPEPEKSQREKELEREVQRLEAELERVLLCNELLVIERDHARREAGRLAAEWIDRRLNAMLTPGELLEIVECTGRGRAFHLLGHMPGGGA